MKLIELLFKFAETYSQESNWQQASIGSGNGLALNRQHALPELMMTQFTDIYMQH